MGRILVVDYDQKAGAELVKLLEEDGHAAFQASEAKTALKLISEELLDVVLLDIAMPDDDGFGILEDLRRDPSTRSLPVVIVSASRRRAEREAAARLGVVDYIDKPWTAAEIKLRVKWVLNGAGTVPAVPWDLSDRELTAPARGNVPRDLRSSGWMVATLSHPGAGMEVVTPEEGGTVETKDGAVRVEVPGGAIRNVMALGATPVTEDAPPLPASLRVKMGRQVADLTFSDRTGTPIEGVRLDKPAKISIKYEERDVSEARREQDLAILRYNRQTGIWVGMPTTFDRKKRMATTWARSFSSQSFDMGAKVLVVEDEESARLPLVHTVESAGFSVLQESDGGNVGRRVSDERPDVILLDLTLPRLDGFQVLRQIKGDPATRRISVIIFSDNDEQDTVSTSMTLGARDFILKPWHAGDVQRRVKRAFESSRARMRQEERAVARANTRRKARNRRTSRNAAARLGPER